MTIRDIKVQNSRLVEGEYYTFEVLKQIELTDNEGYFVLKDPFGYKFLLPSQFYLQYGFEAGMQLKCRVDKINCNGRMFLEPEHPIYKEGEIYDFPVRDKGSRLNLFNEKEFFLKVEDAFGIVWDVRVFSEKYLENLKNQVCCRLERIKKGKLFLSLAHDISPQTLVQSGNWYEFTIEDEKKNPQDGIMYFVMLDAFGTRHLMKKKYYLHYGLKIGQKLQCKVEKFTSSGYFFLEPENPWYKVGEVYYFAINQIQKLHYANGKSEYVLLLNDPYHEDIKIFVSEQQALGLENTKGAFFRVDRIRKSRPELRVCNEIS